jgi:hypothetical protein
MACLRAEALCQVDDAEGRAVTRGVSVTVSHHPKVLRQAGSSAQSARPVAYDYVIPDALTELSAWLSWAASRKGISR